MKSRWIISTSQQTDDKIKLWLKLKLEPVDGQSIFLREVGKKMKNVCFRKASKWNVHVKETDCCDVQNKRVGRRFALYAYRETILLTHRGTVTSW